MSGASVSAVRRHATKHAVLIAQDERFEGGVVPSHRGSRAAQACRLTKARTIMLLILLVRDCGFNCRASLRRHLGNTMILRRVSRYSIDQLFPRCQRWR